MWLKALPFAKLPFAKVHSIEDSLRRSRPEDQEAKCLKDGMDKVREYGHFTFERKQLEISFTSEYYHRLSLNTKGTVSEIWWQKGGKEAVSLSQFAERGRIISLRGKIVFLFSLLLINTSLLTLRWAVCLDCYLTINLINTCTDVS